MDTTQGSTASKIRTVAIWVGALTLWLVIVGVYSNASSYALGEAAGKFLVYGVISTVILRWSPKTRQLAPLGAILLGVFFLIKGHREPEHARVVATSDLSRAGAAMDAMSRGDALSQVAGVDTPPEGPNGQVAWFVRTYSERYASAQHQMAIEEGADIDMLPREWPQAKYIADATAYPAVETYFLGYLRYLDKAREHYPVLMDSIASTTVIESKMGSADSADVMKGMTNGLASKREANVEMFNYGQAYGQAALRLHYFLASVGSRVSYNSGLNTARFEVDAERKRASILLADLQNSAAKLGGEARLRNDEQHQKLDNLTGFIKH